MDRLEDLSEKEKQALRLILRGHDAKSMARELSLSVHTINERLRIARRKLGVTSSREAARVLLGSEGETPQNRADKELGGAPVPRPDDDVPAAEGKPARRMLAGVLVMMTLFAAGLILAAQATGPAPETPRVEAPASDAAVIEAARDWLALADAGDWQRSFDAAGAQFRKVNTVAGWAKAATQVRAPLGALVSREVRTVRYLNAPPHGYQEVTFGTRYANRSEELVETVTLQLEGGSWRVVGVMVE